jgi:HlyD family secretion protein
MAKLNSTLGMLVITGAITAAIIAVVNWTAPERLHAQLNVLDMRAEAQETKALPQPVWAASATGRIEPKTGEYRLSAATAGEIEDVLIDVHDKVEAGDILVRLDDKDLFAKRRAAIAEVEVRLRERSEEPVTGQALERQNAEDSYADAERAVFRAQQELDDAVIALRNGSGASDDVTGARNRLTAAEKKLEDERQEYKKIAAKSGMPKPTRLDTGLTQSLADLSLVEAEIERTRLRAPFSGSVLKVWAREGEVAAPSSAAPLVLFGDVSSLRVKAELEERDVVKVRKGQKVIVRSDAFPGRDFVGKVTSLGAALGSPSIASRGPRRPSDIDVLEVIGDLGEQPDLLPGMRVDVFFANDETAATGTN